MHQSFREGFEKEAGFRVSPAKAGTTTARTGSTMSTWHEGNQVAKELNKSRAVAAERTAKETNPHPMYQPPKFFHQGKTMGAYKPTPTPQPQA